MLTKKILTEINTRPQQSRKLWLLVVVGAGAVVIATPLLYSYTLALAVFLAGATCVWRIYRRESAERTTSLVYDLDAETGARFAAIQEACEGLGGSARIWLLTEQRARASTPTANGAAPTTDRQRVEVGCLQTPGIFANVDIWGIDADDTKVFFFPEAILVYQQDQYRAVSYESFKVALSATRSVEEEVPEDAKIVGHTWRFTKEDGRPDRRYANNPQLAIVLYGRLRLTGSSGLNMTLQVSNRTAANRFAWAFGMEVRERPREEGPPKQTSEPKGQEKPNESERRSKPEPAAECEILGVTPGSSMSEIADAYRKLALTYHPDKVAHLSPEVREFADNKMKEINAAYAELKRHRR